ncbi:hypothetical protein QRX50_07455 [Amycolatopsis carbonis]|uniref:Uncharacterized protein n=1 Tax=Amycolatopsis carbonis TaxID=715471 RepID=A0A9Y2IK08_9PSEU|nr:hypothetical protein [Amycolatopsis sp. 2-15]WIX80595.1 hypothetical protein QRX50_07455 [Amycolatopsis sp. 2-15]
MSSNRGEVPADTATVRWERLGETLGAMVRGETPVGAASRSVREQSERLGSPEVLRDLQRWIAMLDSWIPTDVTPVSFCEDQILQQARELLAGTWPPVTR